MKRFALVAFLCFAAGLAAGNWDWITLAGGPSGELPVLVHPGAVRIYDTPGGRLLAAFEQNQVQLFKPGQMRPAVNLAVENTGGLLQLSDYYGSPTVALSGATGTVAARGYFANGRRGRTGGIEFVQPDGTIGRLEFSSGIAVQ
jgi:hypothetical protein